MDVAGYLEAVQRVRKLASERRWSEALAFIEDILRQHQVVPANLLVLRGRYSQLLDDDESRPPKAMLEQAADSFALATNFEPECLAALIEAGYFQHAIKNDNEMALANFERACTIAERYLCESLFAIGMVHLDNREYMQAERVCAELRRRFPEDIESDASEEIRSRINELEYEIADRREVPSSPTEARRTSSNFGTGMPVRFHAPIRELVHDLATGKFEALEKDGRLGHLGAGDLATILSELGATRIEVPAKWLESSRTYDLEGQAASWEIEIDLHSHGSSTPPDLILTVLAKTTRDGHTVAIQSIQPKSERE